MGRQPKRASLDPLRALLLRADALWAGQAGRLSAVPPTPGHRAKADASASELAQAVELSVEENRLHLTLRGFLDAPQAEALLVDLQIALARLRPGFDVISDVSTLGGLTSTATPLLRRAATSLVEAGMRRMVSVVGSSKGAATTVARAVEGIYEARVVASTAEAARLLDRVNGERTAAPPSPPAPPTAPRRGARRRESAPAPAAKGRR
jgi:hypothetical protein